ncbi:protein TolR [Flavisphingomonas formosensis]|uniref:protein TolR n=1 Tax=Flavisphingomonas formosensis TaxID=861534 RepID=UPI0012FCDBEE|nr:protein TolR [Sphingomonas formosensis]
MAMGPLPSRRGGRGRAPMAEINVTPLVDVMLVLLIIFMIAAPLMASGVPVDLPDSRASPLDQNDKPIQISLDPKGAVYIDEEPVPDGSLADRLTMLAGGRTGKDAPQIFLRADRSLDYGRVMKVMGELNHAGLNKVALVTVGEGDGEKP